MQDVPVVDFAGKAQVVIQEEALKVMPAPVRAIYDDESLRHHLYRSYICTGFSVGQVCIYAPSDYRKSDELRGKLAEIGRDFELQHKERKELEIKVRSMIYACTSIRQALKALPEFAEYLPTDGQRVCTTLPTVTNVVTDLMNAGWKQPKAEE
jgi:hypothetical protein